MKYVIEQVKKNENKQRVSVILIEIDYELVTLYDAMQAGNHEDIEKTKEKLTMLVNKLVKIAIH